MRKRGTAQAGRPTRRAAAGSSTSIAAASGFIAPPNLYESSVRSRAGDSARELGGTRERGVSYLERRNSLVGRASRVSVAHDERASPPYGRERSMTGAFRGGEGMLDSWEPKVATGMFVARGWCWRRRALKISKEI